MSELDQDNAKSIDDEETDDIEEIEDEIDQNVQVAELQTLVHFKPNQEHSLSCSL